MERAARLRATIGTNNSVATNSSVRISPMSRPPVWASKVASLIQGGNSPAALAQIKVAPSVKDVEQLRVILAQNGLLARHPRLDAATQDQIAALLGSRLHRSP